MAVVSIKNKLRRGNLLVGNEAYDPGGMVPIATTVVGSGGVASVTFSSIPQTYSHLQLRIIGRSDNATNESYIALTYNNVTTNNYTEHGIYADGASVYANGGTGNPFAIAQRLAGGNATSGIFGAIVIDILDYTNTNKLKTMRSLGGVDRNGAGAIGFYSSILTTTTDAITRLDLKSNLGNLVQYSHFALYGIKSA